MIGISKLYCGTSEPSDALRYGADARRSPARRPGPKQGRRPIVVWNCTPRCNLACVHCYSQSNAAREEPVMSTAQAEAMLEDLAAFGIPVVLFSGGEPLLRDDVPALAARAARLGMRTVVSTNGTRITPAMAARLADAGLGYAGVSLDGVGSVNDRFRGVGGAFEAALAGIRNCRDAGVKTGLRFTITRSNAAEVPAIFDLLHRERIPRVCFYHLVYAGRGSSLVGEDLDADAKRRLVDLIIDRTAALHAAGHPAEVLTVNNHADGAWLYLRMLRENHPRTTDALALLARGGGEATGSGIACVSWDGSVHPSQFWRHAVLGNVTQRPFSQIWSDPSCELLTQLRDRRRYLHGRCATCRFLGVCNANSRVRAEAVTGDTWAPDPACYLSDDEIAGEPPAGAEP